MLVCEISGFRILGVFTPLDSKYSDAWICKIVHLDRRSNLLEFNGQDACSKTSDTRHSTGVYLLYGPSSCMTMGCDHGPNSWVLCDFTFHESTLCSMLKPMSREIAISQIRHHAPLWIRRPKWILEFWDFGSSTFQKSINLSIPHFIFPKMDFSIIQI